MSVKKTKKWIPVVLLVLFSAGAVAALLLLPDSAPDSHPGPKPTAATSGATTADLLPNQDPPPALDPERDADDELLPRLPTIDEEEHGYPTPFAKPEKPESDSQKGP